MKISQQLIDHCRNQLPLLGHNEILFEINEGNLLPYVKAAMQKQLSGKSLEKALHRVAPINILKKIVDKLSKIYDGAVKREVIDGDESDKEILSWFEKQMHPNKVMGLGNEFFNLFKNTLIQPYVSKGQPFLRAIPSHQFTVYSEDTVNPNLPTHVIVSHKIIDDRQTYRIYTDEEFAIVDSSGRTVNDEMARIGADGVNEYGRIPFVYINRSQNLLIPRADTDTLALTILLPVLLTDLNFAAMYQTFSIVYGINLNSKNLEYSPAVFWDFQTKENEQKPELGTIKPEVDIDQVIRLIVTELSLWMNSRGIKPGSVGDLTQDNMASGISKMVDEMDTTEDRKKQVEIFRPAETELWDLVMHSMLPVWQRTGQIDSNMVFSEAASVETLYGDQAPMASRVTLIDEQQKEVAAGFTTRRRAIKRLNPMMSDDEIEELLNEMEEERAVVETTENISADTAEDDEGREDSDR